LKKQKTSAVFANTSKLDCHVDCQIHQQNQLNLFFSSYLSTESRSVLPNLSLVMEFLENIFNNFVFDKFISHVGLVTGRVTATNKVASN